MEASFYTLPHLLINNLTFQSIPISRDRKKQLPTLDAYSSIQPPAPDIIMSGLYTDEQTRFIYFYTTLTNLNAHDIAHIFNYYFAMRIGHRNMQYAMDNIAYSGQYDSETIGLCDEPWADPAYFGYDVNQIWKY